MKKKRTVFVLLIPFAVIFLLYFGINLLVVLTSSGAVFSPEEKDQISFSPTALLVLGAGVRSNGTPSNMLEDRLLTALSLYEQGACRTIIVSGDHGSDDYNEVRVMKEYLVARGVPGDAVYMDHAGFSTYDSVWRAKHVFGADSLWIVTQSYHAPRAVMIARFVGLRSAAVTSPIQSSDVQRYPRQGWYSFRETIARCKDFFFCVFDAKPRYTGEPISLDAGGDITNDKDYTSSL